MRKNYRLILAAALTLLLISLCACMGGGGQTETSAPPPTTQQPGDDDGHYAEATPCGEVVVTFDYEKQSGSASNQYAVWVEDMDGNYINTIYTTKWTAGGGYKNRPDAIALWVEKSGIASMPDYYVDAVSGATPKTSGKQSYTWNLKDINGDTVSPGEYRVFVEGTLRWKNRVVYSGVIMIGDTPATIQTDAEFVYEASDRQAALTNGSPENAMIGAVTVSFIPAPPRSGASAFSLAVKEGCNGG